MGREGREEVRRVGICVGKTYPFSALRPREPRMTIVGSRPSICGSCVSDIIIYFEACKMVAEGCVAYRFCNETLRTLAMNDLNSDAYLKLGLSDQPDATLRDVFDSTIPFRFRLGHIPRVDRSTLTVRARE